MARQLSLWSSRVIEQQAVAEIAKAFARLALLRIAGENWPQLVHQLLGFDHVLVDARQPRTGLIPAEVQLIKIFAFFNIFKNVSPLLELMVALKLVLFFNSPTMPSSFSGARAAK